MDSKDYVQTYQIPRSQEQPTGQQTRQLHLQQKHSTLKHDYEPMDFDDETPNNIQQPKVEKTTTQSTITKNELRKKMLLFFSAAAVTVIILIIVIIALPLVASRLNAVENRVNDLHKQLDMTVQKMMQVP